MSYTQAMMDEHGPSLYEQAREAWEAKRDAMLYREHFDAYTYAGVGVCYDEYGINPNTWEIHDAYCLYGPDVSLRDKSLVRVCGNPRDARRGVKALVRRHGGHHLLYDIVGPQERLARAVGKPLNFVGKGA